MKKGFMVGILLTLTLAVISCQGSGGGSVKSDPEWSYNTPIEAGYVYFVGYAENLGTIAEVKEEALQNAKTKVMSYIFEEASVQKTFTESGSLSGDEDLLSTYEESIQSESYAQLSGVSADKFDYIQTDDAGMSLIQAWVLVKMSESDIETERQRIIDEIQRQLELVDGKIREAEEAIADGRVMDAVEAYINAALNSLDVEDRMKEFPIYVNEAIEVLGNFQLEADDDNPSDVDITEKTTFTFYVMYNGDDGEIPVSGARVNFSFENNKGDKDESDVSASDGSVECTITALDSVNKNTKLNAKLNLDVSQLINLGTEYKIYALELKDTIDKAAAYSSFSAQNLAYKAINTAVIAMAETDGVYSKENQLTADAYSFLLEQGYTATRLPEGVDLEKIYNLNDSELQKLADQGIMRVFIVYVDKNVTPTYNKTLGRYTANYSVSGQLVDTETAQIQSSDTVRVTTTATSESEIDGAFIQAAAKKISDLID